MITLLPGDKHCLGHGYLTGMQLLLNIDCGKKKRMNLYQTHPLEECSIELLDFVQMILSIFSQGQKVKHG